MNHMFEVKTEAPDFVLKDQDGKTHVLSHYRGSYVLVYFYPKDDTPGCTKEACAIRDLYDEFQRTGVHVFGISVDTVESHKRFAEKYALPFTLLSDPAKETTAAYGASGEPFNKRISYLIDPDGIIAKAYADVDPTTHGGEILKDMYALGNGTKIDNDPAATTGEK
jgi:peroxiredoxin Q/BCP